MKSYHDITGDGGSAVLDQVLDLRGRIAQRLAGVRHLLAIGSGKGGVGKSTLTRHLASALAARGWRVAILDADLNGPSQARLSGLQAAVPLPGADGAVLPRTADGVGVFSLGSLLAEPQPLDFESVTGDESHTWRATRERTLLCEVLAGTEWGTLDALLFDLPPGAERTVQFAEWLGPSAAFLLVSTPSELARGVVARSATALSRLPNKVLGHALNMAGSWCADCGELKPLFPSVGLVEVGVPCLGRIPFDPRLAELADRGGSLSELAGSPAALAVDELAVRLHELLEAS